MDPIRDIFLRAMKRSIHQPGNGSTPRDSDHGWWNCPECREWCHKNNQFRILKHIYFDISGNYYSLPYIEDIMWWLSDQERYEDAGEVQKFIAEWKNTLKTDEVIPVSRYY